MEVAIIADCNILLQKFTNKLDTSFISFCNEWKLLCFQHIYSGQTRNVEILQTTSVIFHLAKRTVCGVATNKFSNKKALLHRIGGIYLMYAVYFKQPTEKYMKIDVSPQTWRKIKDFIGKLPTILEMNDVRYIFGKLIQENAFRFTALDNYVGLEQFVDYSDVEREYFNKCNESSAQSDLKELPEYTDIRCILSPLIVLEGGYNEMKETLYSTVGIDAPPLPATTIFQNIKKHLNNLDKIIKADVTESSQKPTMESRKRTLKREGYALRNKKKVPRTDHSDEHESSHNRPQRRMSARTIFMETLPEDILQDLEYEVKNELEAMSA